MLHKILQPYAIRSYKSSYFFHKVDFEDIALASLFFLL